MISISEKYEEYSKKETSSLCYEVLHTSISAIIDDFLPEKLEKIPAPYRSTVQCLERKIFEKTSKNYQEEFMKHKAEQVDDCYYGCDDADDCHDEYDNNDEDDDNYELKWIENPSYTSNLIL